MIVVRFNDSVLSVINELPPRLCNVIGGVAAIRQELPADAMPVHPWDKEFKPGLRLQAEQATALAGGGTSDLPTLSYTLRTIRFIERIFAL